MNVTVKRPAVTTSSAVVDTRRWPEMAPPRPAPVRAAVARILLHRVARRTGIRIELPGAGFGPVGGPKLRLEHPTNFFRRVGRDGKIGFGEAFMAGDWDALDLVAVLERMARHLPRLVPPSMQRLRRIYDAHHPADEDNDRAGARRNIARHYDLSNELFARFLDPTMTYSSALFDEAAYDVPLEAAQVSKVERVLDLADVRPGTRVLEIGTGWGELALRAAARGAFVTTVTLSAEQAGLARDRIAAAGLSDLVDVRVQDYRDVTGSYDAVVSVEMIEAVGERWWPAYFAVLDARLAPGGRVALQTILMPHDRLLATRTSWTWIHKYIFPGGLIPSAQAITELTASHTRLRIMEEEHFGPSYAETLHRWRNTFTAHESEIAALGFDAAFRRMWTFYLAYCEAGFRAGYLDVAHLLLRRTGEAE